MRVSRSQLALGWAPVALLLVLPLSLASASVAAALPMSVSAECIGDGSDPECVPDPETPPTDGETTPEAPPVGQPVEQPPIQQPSEPEQPAQPEQPVQPEQVQEDTSYYSYYEEDESVPEAVVPAAPTVTVPVPTPTPTPKAAVTPEPAGWTFPLYTGEPEHDANVLAISALVMSLLAAGAVTLAILVRRTVIARRMRRAAPRFIPRSMTLEEATSNVLPSREPGFSEFDMSVLSQQSGVAPR